MSKKSSFYKKMKILSISDHTPGKESLLENTIKEFTIEIYENKAFTLKKILNSEKNTLEKEYAISYSKEIYIISEKIAYKLLQAIYSSFTSEEKTRLKKEINESQINILEEINILVTKAEEDDIIASTSRSDLLSYMTEEESEYYNSFDGKMTPQTRERIYKEIIMKSKAPKAEAPETEAPKTEAPQTEAPETEAPKAEAPETKAPKAEARVAAAEVSIVEAAKVEAKKEVKAVVDEALIKSLLNPEELEYFNSFDGKMTPQTKERTDKILAARAAEKAKTPEAETPKAETPKAETPKAETPKAETPETKAPETKAPETEAPEAETPETKAPETKASETKAPETEAPETKAPETKASETKAPETEAPETKAPETKAPETEAPETKAPETKAPETEAPEAETPETKVPETKAPETEAPETEAPETKAKEAAKALKNPNLNITDNQDIELDTCPSNSTEKFGLDTTSINFDIDSTAANTTLEYNYIIKAGVHILALSSPYTVPLSVLESLYSLYSLYNNYEGFNIKSVGYLGVQTILPLCVTKVAFLLNDLRLNGSKYAIIKESAAIVGVGLIATGFYDQLGKGDLSNKAYEFVNWTKDTGYNILDISKNTVYNFASKSGELAHSAYSKVVGNHSSTISDTTIHPLGQNVEGVSNNHHETVATTLVNQGNHSSFNSYDFGRKVLTSAKDSIFNKDIIKIPYFNFPVSKPAMAVFSIVGYNDLSHKIVSGTALAIHAVSDLYDDVSSIYNKGLNSDNGAKFLGDVLANSVLLGTSIALSNMYSSKKVINDYSMHTAFTGVAITIGQGLKNWAVYRDNYNKCAEYLSEVQKIDTILDCSEEYYDHCKTKFAGIMGDVCPVVDQAV